MAPTACNADAGVYNGIQPLRRRITSSSPRMPIRCRQARQHTASTVSLHYLAEGAANIVFDIRPSQRNQPGFEFVVEPLQGLVLGRDAFLGHVIRVSKGLEKTVTGEQIEVDFEEEIKPLFEKDDLMDHLLPLVVVNLDPGIVAHLNSRIRTESLRKVSIREDTTVGLLMEDMSSLPGESLTIEIKPKWLAQSPNAPPSAVRCRNCALQALKTHPNQETKKQASTSTTAPPPSDPSYICPLRLLTGTPEITHPFLHHKVLSAAPTLPRTTQSRITNAITSYFSPSGKGHRLLAHLRTLQTQCDPTGILARPASSSAANLAAFDHHIRLAMTFRDCSLFIRVRYADPQHRASDVEIETKLGDLDFKSEAKMGDWRDKEEQLIAGGYYVRDDVGESRCGLSDAR